MKKFNPYEVYALGKAILPVIGWAKQEYPFGTLAWPLFSARAALTIHINAASIFAGATIRASQEVVKTIDAIVPQDITKMLEEDQTKMVPEYKLGMVQDAIKNLETVMSNDMPGISSYVVTQKGIYRTEDLIDRTEMHFPIDIQNALPTQAKKDLQEAGKCLAFEVPTACTFHLWRSVESVMKAYYVKLSGGKTFDDDKINRNWGAYVKALNDKGADSNITKFLDHLREEYRNPQTHPEEMVGINEAMGLFSVATSAILQMVSEIQKP